MFLCHAITSDVSQITLKKITGKECNHPSFVVHDAICVQYFIYFLHCIKDFEKQKETVYFLA